MNRDFQFRDKISVFVSGDDALRRRIAHHPWFQLTVERKSAQVVFLEGEAEPEMAGQLVISLKGPSGVLFAPGINPGHLSLLRERFTAGRIAVRLPTPTAYGLAIVLQALNSAFEVSSVLATALLPILESKDTASLLQMDNVLPEALYLDEELPQLLGTVSARHPLHLSVQGVRVPVSQGTFINASVGFSKGAILADVEKALISFSQGSEGQIGPSAPHKLLDYQTSGLFPSPRFQTNGVAVGQLKPCPVLSYRMAIVAPSLDSYAISTVEYLVTAGLIYW